MTFWTPIIQGAVLMLDVFCFGTSYLVYSEQKEVLRNLENAAKLEVDKHLDKYLDIQPNKSIEYAGIRGKIFSSRRESDGTIQDIQDLFLKFQKYGRHILTHPYITNSETNTTDISYPFTLHSPEGKSLPFKVLIDSVSWGDKFHLRTNAFSDAGPAFYGIKGKQFVPQGDTIITVFGKISKVGPGEIRIQYTGDDGAPFIFTTSSPEELISTQRYYINFSRIILLSFTVFGLVVLGNFIHKEWKKYWRHRQRLGVFDELLEAIPTQEDKPVSADSNDNPTSSSNAEGETHRLCVVCKVEERNTMFSDCNHVSTCQQCALKSNNVCPICSKVSEQIISAYMS